MTNTGFKAMNNEELDLVTGGFPGDELFKVVKQVVNSDIPKIIAKEAPDDYMGALERLGANSVIIGKQIVNKVKSWLP